MQTQISASPFLNFRSKKKNLIASLSLTSLIDAFSILVIYLLLVTQNGLLDIEINTQVQIPQSEVAPFVETEPLVVRLQNNSFYIKDTRYSPKELVLFLKAEKKKNEDIKLGIQASKSQSFETIQRMLETVHLAGIHKVELLTERSP